MVKYNDELPFSAYDVFSKAGRYISLEETNELKSQRARLYLSCCGYHCHYLVLCIVRYYLR